MATQNSTTTQLEDKVIKYHKGIGMCFALIMVHIQTAVWYDVKTCADGCFGGCSILHQHRSKEDSLR